MTPEQTYLAWMRVALWGEMADQVGHDGRVGEGHDGFADEGKEHDGTGVPKDVLAVANRQKTRGLIFDALLRDAGLQPGLPEETKTRMREFLLQNFNTHRILDASLTRAVEALRSAGIPAVLLKGQGAARSYPNPPLRECGDIDLYIGPERLEDAVRVLTPLAVSVDDQLRGKHWELRLGEAEIELHQHSMLPESRRLARFYRTLEAEGFTRGLVPLDFGGVRVDTPEPTFNAFYLFYHAWHHFLQGGIGFRQLCDWTLHLHAHAGDIDRERLLGMVKGMHLQGPWQQFCCIAVHDLGLPAAECPGYDPAALARSRKVLALILAEGNFGRGVPPRGKRPESYLGGKLYSLFSMHFRRFCRLLPIAPREAAQNFVSLFAGGIRRILEDLFKR